MPRSIVVLVPVLDRPARVAPLLASFAAATADADARIFFIAQASDAAEIAAVQAAGHTPLIVPDADGSWARKINAGFAHTDEPWMLLGADDLKFHAGWIDTIRTRLASHPGVIGTNDLGHAGTIAGTHSTHPLVRRSYARALGTIDAPNQVVHPGYHHNFPDTELVATAQHRGLYLHAADCIVEHLHPNWRKGTMDNTYRLGQSRFAQDHALFLQRRRQFGF